MIIRLLLVILITIGGVGYCSDEGTYIEGRVFNDINQNLLYDAGEDGIKGVKVSNGVDIVTTNRSGKYKIPVTEDTVVFVIKPNGWATPLDENNLPLFYHIHKPYGSKTFSYEKYKHFDGVAPTKIVTKVDFPLFEQKEPDEFKVLLFGDTQPRNQKEINYIAHDVVEELIGTDCDFGITLGDNVFNNLSLHSSLIQTIGNINIPWYYVIGNHDHNFDVPEDKYAQETFERFLGPPYYSFDYSSVHFIVMDDIVWLGAETGKYDPGLGENQLEFIQNDIALVPEDNLIVILMHIPLDNESWMADDREKLFSILEKRKNCLAIAAHEHVQSFRFLGEKDNWHGENKLLLIVNGTVCGSWWSGAPDELGIPHTTMRDGAPNGYAYLTCKGNQYSWVYKAARRPADYQMNIYAPESIDIKDANETEVLVNVFGGSGKSVVEMKVGDDGEWLPMEKTKRIDPQYQKLVEQNKDKEFNWSSPGRDIPKASECRHLWAAKLPENSPTGSQLISVRTTDMFGNKYNGCRIIRITGEQQEDVKDIKIKTW